MYECHEVSNTALHNFPWPQAFKEEIRNENQRGPAYPYGTTCFAGCSLFHIHVYKNVL